MGGNPLARVWNRIEQRRRSAAPLEWNVDAREVQGLPIHGFDWLDESAIVLVRFARLGALARLLAHCPVSFALDANEPCGMNIAFSYGWFTRLGLPERTLVRFDTAFREGMATPDRSIRLGDEGSNAPAEWDWGSPSRAPFDAALFLYARDEAELIALRARAIDADTTVVAELRTTLLGGREHFGFNSGIAQPFIGTTREGQPRPGLLGSGRSGNTVAPGEFLLGHGNEYRELRPIAQIPSELDPRGDLPRSRADAGLCDFGAHGSYVVVRQLSQDVQGFWRALTALTDSREERDRLAAKLVGRWPSGAPIALSPDRDRPDLATADDFGYAEDPGGFRCPIGAHIRRANPRDWRLAADPALASSISNKHRIIRRSRPYGRPLSPTFDPTEMMAPDGEDRGLAFMAICADIARQFEMIQEGWINNPCFARLANEVDPLIGTVRTSNRFSVQSSCGTRRRYDLPQFVTVRGGAYLFMPSASALRFLRTRAAQREQDGNAC